LRPAFYP